MAKAVSQSRTEWVKKGTVVAGKKVKKGYVAQKGRPEKRVTARIKLEEATRRGKAGDVAVYKSGRYKKTVGKGRVDRSKKTAGGGVTKAQAAAARRNADRPAAPRPKPGSYGSGVSTSTIRGIEKASGRRFKATPGGLAGSGKDNVNAASSSGSGKVSSATDSLFRMPRGVQIGGVRPTPKTPNRPSSFRGGKTQLKRSSSGLRWVKVGK